jgi:hypothetical protein
VLSYMSFKVQVPSAVPRGVCCVAIVEGVLLFAFPNAVAELGRDALTTEGYHVLGGYMSPVNDLYNKKVPLSRLGSLWYKAYLLRSICVSVFLLC